MLIFSYKFCRRRTLLGSIQGFIPIVKNDQTQARIRSILCTVTKHSEGFQKYRHIKKNSNLFLLSNLATLGILRGIAKCNRNR